MRTMSKLVWRRDELEAIAAMVAAFDPAKQGGASKEKYQQIQKKFETAKQLLGGIDTILIEDAPK